MVKIIKLEKKYLVKASRVADDIFKGENPPPSFMFQASLNKETFSDIIGMEYFIAVNEEDNVIGTSGLYLTKEDYKDSCWLGWYCVDKKYREKGIGTLLLDYAINEAKTRGKKFLNLYTSTNPREKAAQKIYEKKGFKITDRKREKCGKYEIFFRKKEL